MRMLIVAATMDEVAPLGFGEQYVGSGFIRILHRDALASHSVDLLVTGVGMVATAVHCTSALALERYDLALNLGVCGSFDGALTPGTVVHVTSERLSELGAEDGDHFLPAEDIGLLRDDLFSDGVLMNPRPPSNAVLASLKTARGITVNTVHGNERSIEDVVRRCSPQVESMEGAAFFYACLTHGLPFAEVRAVSNVVERRNRERWKMGEAIARLCETAHALIEAA
jgi:futalosine hydrolase